MMMQMIKFRAGDIDLMNVQDAQAWMKRSITLKDQELIAEMPIAFTVLDGEEVIACFGIAEIWKNRGYGWTFLSKDIGRRIGFVTRVCKATMEASGYKRIEAAVECDFEQGHRWMGLLGMEKECDRMKSYMQNGSDCSLYAMVM